MFQGKKGNIQPHRLVLSLQKSSGVRAAEAVNHFIAGSVQNLFEKESGLFSGFCCNFLIGLLTESRGIRSTDLFLHKLPVEFIDQLKAARLQTILIALGKVTAVTVMCVSKSRNQAAVPVEIFCRDLRADLREVGRGRIDICIKGNHGIEHVAAHRQPFQAADGLRLIGTDLTQAQEIRAIDGDGSEGVTFQRIAVFAIGVIGRPLEVIGHRNFAVLYGNLALRDTTPGNIVRIRTIVCIFPIPDIFIGVEIALEDPGTGRIVNMIRITV